MELRLGPNVSAELNPFLDVFGIESGNGRVMRHLLSEKTDVVFSRPGNGSSLVQRAGRIARACLPKAPESFADYRIVGLNQDTQSPCVIQALPFWQQNRFVRHERRLNTI